MTLLPDPIAIPASSGSSVPVPLSRHLFAAAREVRLQSCAGAADIRATRFPFDSGQAVAMRQTGLNAAGILGSIPGSDDAIRAFSIDRPCDPAPGTRSNEIIGRLGMHQPRRMARKADRIDAAGFASEGMDVEGFPISPLPAGRGT